MANETSIKAGLKPHSSQTPGPLLYFDGFLRKSEWIGTQTFEHAGPHRASRRCRPLPHRCSCQFRGGEESSAWRPVCASPPSSEWIRSVGRCGETTQRVSPAHAPPVLLPALGNRGMSEKLQPRGQGGGPAPARVQKPVGPSLGGRPQQCAHLVTERGQILGRKNSSLNLNAIGQLPLEELNSFSLLSFLKTRHHSALERISLSATKLQAHGKDSKNVT